MSSSTPPPSFPDPMTVFEEVRKAFSVEGLQRYRESVIGFFYAVDFTERWIQAWIVTLACCLLLVVGTKKWHDFQLFLFGLFVGVIYFAERINALGREHWELFAKQNYFDKQGLWISTMMSAPLVILLMVLLVNMLLESASLMVKVKARDFKRTMKKRAKAEKEGEGGEKKTTGKDLKSE